jgi:serine/threonine-protein kinase
VDEAVAIARQIADALEAAHRQGIVHRDLKPSNIKITHAGTVKVLDFGLAKLTQREGGGSAPDPATSPTITSPHLVTGAGMLLGTAAYMSPEQAKAREADHRSDIWAFGCVLYEMLSGRRAFDGDDATDVLGAVVRLEPDWSALPPAVPMPLVTLLKGCLVKDRRHRIGDISAARFVLDHVAELSPVPGTPFARQRSIRSYVAPAGVAAVLAGTAIGAAVWWWTRPPPSAVTRFSFSPAGAETIMVDPVSRDLAVLPDGRRFVYIARGAAGAGGNPRLFVRAMDRLEPRVLTTGVIPKGPFTSADGTEVGFTSILRGFPELKRVAVNGGPVSTICSLDGQGRGATWGESGQIIFATSNPATGLQRVAAAGGTPETLTTPDAAKGEGDHLWPQYVPGRDLVLFTITSATGGLDASQIAMLDLRTGKHTLLSKLAGSQAQYVRSGHLVYASQGSLLAVRFDVDRLEMTGEPRVVVSGVATLPTGTAEFDVSPDGTLVYIPSSVDRTRTLVWVDRTGREEAVRGAPARGYLHPRLSRDGNQIAVDSGDEENDIWILDLVRQTFRQLTFGPQVDQSPIWMPGGGRVLYTSRTVNAVGLGGPLARAADGTGTVERLAEFDAATDTLVASTVTPDGTRLVGWSASGSSSTNDLMLVDLKTRLVEPLLPMPSVERNAEVSPDGRWLAFESDKDRGQFGVYVVPFPDVDRGQWKVSDGAGGVKPAWARNGRELFYIGLDGAMRSVRLDAGGPSSAGSPQLLFGADYFPGINRRAYDVSPDGRFLMVTAGAAKDSAPPTIVVTQNWIEELKHLPRD